MRGEKGRLVRENRRPNGCYRPLFAERKEIYIFWMGADTVRKAHCVHTSLDEYLKTSKEGGETPTALSGRGQRESLLPTPFCDV